MNCSYSVSSPGWPQFFPLHSPVISIVTENKRDVKVPLEDSETLYHAGYRHFQYEVRISTNRERLHAIDGFTKPNEVVHIMIRHQDCFAEVENGLEWKEEEGRGC